MTIPNKAEPTPRLVTGGEVRTREDLEDLRHHGVEAIINLRSEQEMTGLSEREDAEALGMAYVHIPVAGAQGVTMENVDALHEAMEAHSGAKKIAVHCASSNRVGALLALRARHKLGHSKEEALAFGERAGLTGLKQKVEGML